jgi:hypothetical protein
MGAWVTRTPGALTKELSLFKKTVTVRFGSNSVNDWLKEFVPPNYGYTVGNIL